MNFIAHRGFKKKFPDNTLPAFQAVLDHPCCQKELRGIELDLQMTADHKIPVIHDTAVVDEEGKSTPVASITYTRLQELYRYHNPNHDHTVPLLEEVLDCINHNLILYFEIKEAPYDLKRFTDILLQHIRSYRPRNDVGISSFSSTYLAYIMAQATPLPLEYAVIFRTMDQYQKIPTPLLQSITCLHPEYHLLLEYHKDICQAQKRIQCWAVNAPADVKKLQKLYAQGDLYAIMTDDIDLALVDWELEQ